MHKHLALHQANFECQCIFLHKDLNKIWLQYYEYIECDSTERIKWLGDIDVLKLFVRDLLGDVGKWSSPGHFARAYYYKQSDITWYTNKRSLHFHGKMELY